MKTGLPVVLLIFNRPETTSRQLESLRIIQPDQLFVVADGPRENHPADAERCEQTRQILESIDWTCDVQTNFAESNMGLGRRVSSGISWAFEQVERAIILEDDCVVHPTFFPFCEELLKRYSKDDRVMHIAASNFQRGQRRNNASYYFSKYPHCWGWATWRRAWNHFDYDLTDVSRGDQFDWLDEMTDRPIEARYWMSIWKQFQSENTNLWAARWVYSCWRHGGLSIIPERNMVMNTGFGDDGTNTTRKDWRARMPALPVDFPMRHPSDVSRQREADRFTHDVTFEQTLTEKLLNKLRDIFGMDYKHNTPALNS